MLSDLWIKIELVLKVFKNVPSVGEAQVLREVAGDGPGRLLRGRGDRARPRQELVSGDNILSPGQCGPRHSGGTDHQGGTFCLFQYRSHKTRHFENFWGFIPKMM